jgi:hypothetical protein
MTILQIVKDPKIDTRLHPPTHLKVILGGRGNDDCEEHRLNAVLKFR